MDNINFGPHTSSAAATATSPLRSVSTGQSINDDVQSVVSQAEGVTSIVLALLSHPGQLLYSLTGSGGSDSSDSHIDPTRNSDDSDVSGTTVTTSNRLKHAKAQTCVYFVTIIEISIT